MADPKSLLYLGLDKPLLPYRSYTSPIDESPHFTSGSQNVLGTQIGYLQKRPGFSTAIEQQLSAIPGRIVRIYQWKRWAGSTTNPASFFIMVCSIVGGTSTVWKLNVQSDPSFTLLYTDASSTSPFDFIDSNNFCFFGNATTRQNMRKYDGTDVSLWGLDAPFTSPLPSLTSGALPAGLTFTNNELSGTPTVSGNYSITFMVTDSAGATASQSYSFNVAPITFSFVNAAQLSGGQVGVPYSNRLTTQGDSGTITFTLVSGTLPAGLTLLSTGVISGTPTANGLGTFAAKATSSTGASITKAFRLYIDAAGLALSPSSLPNASQGTTYSQMLTGTGGTGPYSFVLAGGTLPVGLTLKSDGTLSGTPTGYGAAMFTVQMNDASNNGAQRMYSLYTQPSAIQVTTPSLADAVTGQPYSQFITADGGTAPYTYAYTAGAISAQRGYIYGYTYVSIYGHESAMSPLSDSTGLFTDQNVDNSVIAASDPQVNGINLYRTTDGGAADPSIMRLIVALGNTTQTYTDFTQDINLQNQTGPALYVNDPPQPLRGFKWSTGRIWGFSQEATWFTGNEEVTNGIPAECMSDAKNGNFYRWPSEVGGIEVTDNGVDILLSEEVWQVTGDTLDTFRKARILRGGGTTSPTALTVVGNTVFWVDTGLQIWSSDKGEIGLPIRSDLTTLNLAQTFIQYFKFGVRNFLCVLDATNGRLYVYDMDLEQWQTPWTVGATCFAAVQLSATELALLCSFTTGHVLKLDAGASNDDGALYGEQIRSSLFAIVPNARSSNRNTSVLRQLDRVEMEVNTTPRTDTNGQTLQPSPNTPDLMYVMGDDDPTKLPLERWKAVYAQPLGFGDAVYAAQYLQAQRWQANELPMSRRVAFCAIWNAASTPWIVYSLDLASQERV